MNNIDQEQLNRTIDSALESLWVKIIEQNKYATGEEIYTELFSRNHAFADSFWNTFAEERDFEMDVPVGDWE